MSAPQSAPRAAASIWWLAFGYFASYLPYSALTKALSLGALPGLARVPGFVLLPSTSLATLAGMYGYLLLSGRFRDAGQLRVGPVSLPWPGRWTFLSGLCTAGIIATTTLAYTFSGTSIVFMMLLMRGGVLVLAPLVDAVSGRHVTWPSRVALGLSLLALGAATGPGAELRISAAAALDVAVYLAGYFVRLRFMSRLAKSDAPGARERYFAEEQMVATPTLVAMLAAWAFFGIGSASEQLREGFVGMFSRPTLGVELAVGLLSQAGGIFGGLVLLDSRENTFTVPVNRASSVLSGVGATLALSLWLGLPGVGARDLVGAMLVTAAVVVLAVPGVLAARERAKLSAVAMPKP
ncbi:hypothetical protein FGE12_25125 [Aggregicoccus sp. 17bor-14]|uniref:hypothetical protein n=1 Tax=Myxococcaceae TaxID=31 RepID=UPI00129CCB4A|nr:MULTISPECIES: hypothetical protein [Myxococcaceae]MBF5045714.1 hypothetical protein [Simulacricoccus sp. 17bor-14]MRI91450.1 hypothetical protein [Aggregicoccus sp. 17bor-14]